MYLFIYFGEAMLFQGTGPVPRQKPVGAVNCVECSDAMPRSERQAGRRPFQIITTQQPACSVAGVAAAYLCPTLQSRPGSLGRVEHTWSIGRAGNSWTMMEICFEATKQNSCCL